MDTPPLTPDWIRQRLQHAAARGHAPLGSQGDGNPDDRQRALQASGRRIRPAAVLILLLQQHPADPDPALVLTQRSARLHDHPGQISFPGGRQEHDDPDLITTALRESEEEIGADRRHIAVLGTLAPYLTSSAYAVTPVVASAVLPQHFRPDPFEVENLFTVPLRHILAAEHWRRDSLMRAGQRREYWAVPYAERYIWGATAGMLRDFREVLLRGE